MSCETISETLFAQVCARHAYRVMKIPTATNGDGRTPDFLVTTPSSDLIAETKEFRPNRDDLRYICEMKEKHQAAYGGTVGSRAREAIRDAAVQLRQFSSRHLPMIVVLYDNIRTRDGRVGMPMSFTEIHHIVAAMYGNLVVTVPLDGSRVHAPDKAGGGRCLTETRRRYVSAVCVLSDWDNETLYIFHNFFADIALSTDIFSGPKCFHYRKAAIPWTSPWKWEQIQGQSARSVQ